MTAVVLLAQPCPLCAGDERLVMQPLTERPAETVPCPLCADPHYLISTIGAPQ